MPRNKSLQENRTLYQHIGKKLKQERILQNVTIRQLAKKLNRSRYFVLDAEAARYKIPLDKLYEYCAVLDIEIKELLPDFIPGSSTETMNEIRNQCNTK